MEFPIKLKTQLNSRIEDNSYRELKTENTLINFSSNDYLGFSQNRIDSNALSIGSTGSRLITGNTKEIEHLEQKIAKYHNAKSGLIFNSGYTANLGLFSTLPQRGDVVLYDQYIHASIRDGIRLSNSKAYSFNHNSIEDLERLLIKHNTTVYVAIESVYSMTGDSPDLIAISLLCEKYNAYLIVDEAHSFGLVGENGQGLVTKLNLQDNVFATIITFGKALGCHGAIVLGSNDLRTYLINFCRAFIYTTAPSPHNVNTINQQYLRLEKEGNKKKIIFELKDLFIQKVSKQIKYITGNNSAIISVEIGSNSKTKELAHFIQSKGFDVRPILSPTVPKGKESIRICFHIFNTKLDVSNLAKSFNLFYEK